MAPDAGASKSRIVRQPGSLADPAILFSPTRKLQKVQALAFNDAAAVDGDIEGEAAEASRALGSLDDELEDDDFRTLPQAVNAATDRESGSWAQGKALRKMAEKGPTREVDLLEEDDDFGGLYGVGQPEGAAERDEPPKKKPKKMAVVTEGDGAANCMSPRSSGDLELDGDFGEFIAPAIRIAGLSGSPGHSTIGSAETSGHAITTEDLEALPDFADRPTAGPSRPSPLSQPESQALPSISQLLGPRPTESASVSQTRNVPARWIPALPISATTFEGKRMRYQRRKRVGIESSALFDSDKLRALEEQTAGLLEEPIHRLYARAQKEREAERLARLRGMDPDEECEASRRMARNAADPTLWTDRYRPQKFIHLLGDERVFRNAMSWLKEWDACVFASAASAASRKKAAKKRSQAVAFAANPSGSSIADSLGSPVDPLGRPQEKVMLLCGPPGLGKTTMAHVLASQAGYEVVEINASDDRTAKVVHERIRNALESKTLDRKGVGGGMQLKGNRPTCVIIDEVDGAAGGQEGGFVRALVKLITEGSVVRKSKGKSKKAEQRPLVRPIICICNDLFAPVLRPLRPLARIVRFAAPANATVIKRLRSICETEGLLADTKNLATLVDSTGGDLRSCLNSLQFIKSLGDRVDEAALASAAVGRKDTGTSAPAALSALFRVPVKKKAQGDDTNGGRYINRLVRNLTTCGEYDRIIGGCFESYACMKQQAETWRAYGEAHDWLDFYDRLDKRIRHDQSYELLSYVPYSVAPWYGLFANVSNKAPEYPRTDYEMYLKRTAHQEICDAFRLGMPVSLRNSFTAGNVAAELVPLLMRILSAEMKPVNSQVIRREERAVLQKMVKLMLDLNLRFVEERTEEGQLVFKVEPPIDVFVHYEGKRASDIPTSRYAVRKMVSREMEIELIRRAEGSGEVPIATTADSLMAAYRKPKANGVADGNVVTAAVDFFGRPIIVQAPQAGELGGAANPVKKPVAVLFKFQEGFSNAVKKPIKLHEFLCR